MNPVRILIILFLFFLPALTFAASGKAIFVIGSAHIVKTGGDKLVLKRGDQINDGDTIVTSKKGQVQIKMSDGTLLAIRPSSQFQIDQYQYEQNVSTDKSIYKLIKGGFRSITGKMGKTKKSSYAVKTVVGTIGIRGTDFSARLCENNCGDSDNGLYVGVMAGGVVLSNDSGTLDVSPGDFGFISDIGVEPDYLQEMPGDLLFAQSNGESSNTIAQQTTVDTNSTVTTTNIASLNPNIATPSASNTGDNLIAGVTPVTSTINNTTNMVEDIIPDQVEEVIDPTPIIDPGIALPSVGVATYIGTTNSLIADSNDFLSVTLDDSTTKLTVDFATTDVTAEINFNNIIASDNVIEAEIWTTTANMKYDQNGDFSGTLSGNSDSNMVNRTITGTTSGSLADSTQSSINAPSTVSSAYALTESNSTYTLDGSIDFTLTGVK